MSATLLAAIEGVLIIGGAIGARRFVRYMARENSRKTVLTAAVTAWTILFGLLPFLAFAVLATEVSPGGLGILEAAVLNLIPFAAVSSPVVGYAHGMAISRPGSR